MKKLLLLTLIALSLKAELLELDVMEETALYKIYCIKESINAKILILKVFLVIYLF